MDKFGARWRLLLGMPVEVRKRLLMSGTLQWYCMQAEQHIARPSATASSMQFVGSWWHSCSFIYKVHLLAAGSRQWS